MMGSSANPPRCGRAGAGCPHRLLPVRQAVTPVRSPCQSVLIVEERPDRMDEEVLHAAGMEVIEDVAVERNPGCSGHDQVFNAPVDGVTPGGIRVASSLAGKPVNPRVAKESGITAG